MGKSIKSSYVQKVATMSESHVFDKLLRRHFKTRNVDEFVAVAKQIVKRKKEQKKQAEAREKVTIFTLIKRIERERYDQTARRLNNAILKGGA